MKLEVLSLLEKRLRSLYSTNKKEKTEAADLPQTTWMRISVIIHGKRDKQNWQEGLSYCSDHSFQQWVGHSLSWTTQTVGDWKCSLYIRLREDSTHCQLEQNPHFLFLCNMIKILSALNSTRFGLFRKAQVYQSEIIT